MEEKHRFVLWKDDDIDPCVWLGFYPDTNVYGIYSDLSETEIALDNSDIIEMCKEILEREGYDITKRQPEIAPCPGCKCEVSVRKFGSGEYQVICGNCDYHAPFSNTRVGAITKHHQITGGTRDE